MQSQANKESFGQMESKHIIYEDGNNSYGCSMDNFLPYGTTES